MQARKSQVAKFIGCLIFLLCAATGARAQEITGEITGTVTDASGARVPGAAVEITNTDTSQVARTLHTNGSGVYSAPLLQIGNYSVKVTAQGFEPQILEHIEVDVSSSVKTDVSLKAGSRTENVDVTSVNQTAPDLENGAVSSVITGTEIKDLTLNTRNFEQLVQLQPGVTFGGASDQLYTGRVSPSGAASSSGVSINGLRSDQNAWTLDGADMLAHNTGSQVVIYPSIEAIGQLSVLRNSYGAQYGGGGNAQIEVTTRAGGSVYHGDMFMFARNAIFNANDYFANLVGQPRLQDSEYDGGLAIGGPVYIPHLLSKERLNTFFFYSLEIRRDAIGLVQSSTDVPTAAELQGIFPSPVCQYTSTTSTACLPTTQLTDIDPTAAAYVKDVMSKVPAPNNPLNPNGLVQDKVGDHNENEQMIRLDHTWSPRLTTFFRFIHDPIFLYTPNGYGNGSGFEGVSDSNVTTTGNAFLLHATSALSNSTVVDGMFSYEPFSLHAIPVGALADAPDVHINLPFPSSLPRVPNVSIQGTNYQTTGPINDVNENFQASINVFHGIGRHSLSVGGNWELYREKVNDGVKNSGVFSFQQAGGAPANSTLIALEKATANFLQGRVSTFQQLSVDPVSNASISLAEGYIQDDWKALPRLTLNAGLRYSFFQEPHEAGHHFGSFEPRFYNPLSAPTLDSTGAPCLTAPCAGGAVPNPNYVANNGYIVGGIDSPYGEAVSQQPALGFGPRLGFAMDVFGDGKTSLKGGFGIYFSETQLEVVQNSVENNPLYVQQVIFNAPPSFASPGTNASLAPQTAYGVAEHWHTPYTQGYSLEVQQAFPRRTMVDLAYSGNVSRHLIGQLDLNQPYPGEFVTSGILGGVSGPCATVKNGICTVTTVNSTNTPMLNLLRPYQGYGVAAVEVPEFSANYNALQTQMTTNLGSTSRIVIAYTWSRGMTNNTTATGAAPQNSYNPSAEYGPINFDRRNVFTAYYVYTLPFFKQQHGWTGHVLGGWGVRGVVTVASGLSLTPTTGVNADPAGLGLLAPDSPETERPDQTGAYPNADAPHSISAVETHNRITAAGYWFNPGDFGNVPVPTCPVNQLQICVAEARPGTSRIGAIRGPGYQVWNLSLSKDITVTGSTHLEFRADAFNLFNHVNWQNIGLSLVGNNFGQITSDRDPRQMSLGARFFF